MKIKITFAHKNDLCYNVVVVKQKFTTINKQGIKSENPL